MKKERFIRIFIISNIIHQFSNVRILFSALADKIIFQNFVEIEKKYTRDKRHKANI